MELLDRIFTGRHCIVHKTLQDNTPAVIKIYNNTYANNYEIDAYEREFAIGKSIHHENVIETLAISKINNQYALITEDFGGVSIKAYKFQNIEDFLEIALQITQGLAAIHQQKIIHLDINPSNILINLATKRVKIIDFSISTTLNYQTTVTSQDIKGTVLYISPEQTGRMNRLIDYRTDFYSLGITFYELLTGKLPFYSEDFLEVIYAHIAKSPSTPYLVDAQIPEAVSKIIMKLMAKNAEDRYQSVGGIISDLTFCLNSFQGKNNLEDFIVAAKDISYEFKIPQKLYGRDQEKQILIHQFQDVCTQGKTALLLVGGYSGIGKSALVNEIQKDLTKERGYFITGKFDQLQKNIPYSALIQAFKGLIKQLLTESEAQIAYWREMIQSVLGNNGKLITEILPDLELIIGEQPPIQELDPQEAKNRFDYILENFIKIFTKKTHPLVIFLDDLQWADSITLKWIERLLLSDPNQYLYLIGAYRDNEVDVSHMLTKTLEVIQESQPIQEIKLANLGLEDIILLLKETLHQKQVIDLAKIIFNKTKGNPFFVNQFLKKLHQEEFIYFDNALSAWQYDLTKVSQVEISDNVVELLIAKIQKLEIELQDILKLAACIGNEFNLYTLSIVSTKDEINLQHKLIKAINEELILKTGTTYKFQHDRIQQAAYTLIPSEDKIRTHLTIGRLILANTHKDEEIEEKIFDILNHLNQGAPLIEDKARKIQLANLNLRAANKAKESTAYQSASIYYDFAYNFLKEAEPLFWEKHYQIAYNIFTLGGEAAFLSGDPTKANLFYEEALKNAKDVIEKAQIYNKQIVLHSSFGNFEEASNIAVVAFKLLKTFKLNLKLSKFIAFLGILKKIVISKWLLKTKVKKVENLLTYPEVEDPKIKITLELIENVTPPLFQTLPHIFPLVMLSNTNFMFKYGLSTNASSSLTSYAFMLNVILKDFKGGYTIGLIAQKLIERFNNAKSKSYTNFTFYGFVGHFNMPHKVAEKKMLETYIESLQTGAFQFGSYALLDYLLSTYARGEVLQKLLQECSKYKLMVKESSIHICLTYILIHTNKLLDTDKIQIENLERHLAGIWTEEASKSYVGAFFYYYFKALDQMWFYEEIEAFHTFEVVEQYAESVQGMVSHGNFLFLQTLTIIRCIKSKEIKYAKKYTNKIKKTIDLFKKWAKHYPANFKAKCLLMEAEYKSLHRNQTGIEALYEESIKYAEENEFINLIGLANECYANYYLEKKQEKLAQIYLYEAYQAFKRWGALGRLKAMDKKYGRLLETLHVSNSLKTSETISVANTLHGGGVSQLLDLNSILKVSQAISQEVYLPKLLQATMDVILENAGAERGVFILAENEHLYVQAELRPEKNYYQGMQKEALEQVKNLPQTVIQYAYRSQERIILAEAFAQGDFTKDTYIQAQQVKSIVALPITNQGKVLGIIYLENNLTTGAFNNHRLDVLNILAKQAGISLENAFLYQNLEGKINELEKTQTEMRIAKEQAEASSLAKTQFLANMSHEIRSPLNAIVGFSQILINQSKKLSLSRDFDSGLSNIKLSGQNLSELINNILDLSKIEAGKMTFSDEVLNLKQLFQGIFHINKVKALAKEINFSYDYDSKLPEIIKSDRTKLNQILMNLTDNAIKFTDMGKAVSLKAMREGDKIIFQVKDEGVGIPQAKQARIFEAFEQADNSVTRKFGGTGLGLAITKKMIDMMQGTISIESEEGCGSTFTVMLPLTESQEAYNDHVDLDLQNYSFKKNNKILVVEDNFLNQEMITALFHELNLEITIAENGKIGIEKTIALQPDIILMDMHMPEMDGMEATKHIRAIEKFANTPIIALSADAFMDQQQKAIAIGVTDYITKPIDFNKLLPILVKYLAQDVKEKIETKTIIPLETKEKFDETLSTLTQIPIYNTDKMLEVVEHLRVMVKEYGNHYTKKLDKLEDIIFAGDASALVNTINQIIHE